MRRGNFKIRIFIFIAIAAFAYLRKCSQEEINPYTGTKQAISLSPQEEIAIGLESAPVMAQQHGGLHPRNDYQALVDKIGNNLVNSSIAKNTPYKYEFHLLADENTINAFALPGGQIFITYALFSKLQNEDQLAGVLGHEIGHVLGKHSNERITNANFWKVLAMGSSAIDMGGLAQQFGQGQLLKNGRGDELESDELGVHFMIDAGYNPNEMIGVMKILKDAAGPNRVPEFQSSHPDPDNRIEKIQEAIEKYKRLL
ncbi:M48 family metalloprotease [Sabulilitoribacter arenilitoris]|uniref:M48 family metalloprotease n=1 Tax=Wocania arenilitoris TaxID=2044858 RepID=A0AAE3EKK9_9FLAO|nr:M48 family metalloprotease [Wocania arenilitoris]MCF7567241.1 M48 family metalloprotease [Wocania arenilitoris]